LRRGVVALFVVGAVAGVGSAAAPTAATPSSPTGVTGISLDGRVELAWQPVSGATGYSVYRATSPANYFVDTVVR
jgi:hypothetical protein